MLPRVNRLDKESFKSVAVKSTPFSSLYFIARVRYGTSTPRFSVTVPKKSAPRAVDRNRLRRQAYRSIAACIPHIPSPISGVFTISPAALKAEKGRLDREIRRVLGCD